MGQRNAERECPGHGLGLQQDRLSFIWEMVLPVLVVTTIHGHSHHSITFFRYCSVNGDFAGDYREKGFSQQLIITAFFISTLIMKVRGFPPPEGGRRDAVPGRAWARCFYRDTHRIRDLPRRAP
jgi:hypothetical protein